MIQRYWIAPFRELRQGGMYGRVYPVTWLRGTGSQGVSIVAIVTNLAKSFPWQSIHNNRYQGAQKSLVTRQLERREAMFNIDTWQAR